MSKARRPSTADWTSVRALYVEGEPAAEPGAPHVFPTMERVAERFGLRHDSLRKRAGREGWLAQRNLYAEALARQKREAKTAAILREAAEFDSASLKLAKAMQGNVAGLISDISRVRGLRDQKIKPVVDDPEAVAQVLADPRLRTSAAALSQLAQALATAQRVGRLALGDTTENTDSRQTHDGAVAVTHDGAVAVDLTHDLAADPARVLRIARILREAGATEE